MSRLEDTGAKELSQPSITEKGFWVPPPTNIPFSLRSLRRADNNVFVVTILSGGDSRVFDSSAWIQLEFQPSLTIRNQFSSNLRWGGLPQHMLEQIMSMVEVQEGIFTQVNLDFHVDGTWSMIQRHSNLDFLSHPFDKPLSIRAVNIANLRCEYTLTIAGGQINLVTINGDSGMHLFKRGLGDQGALPEDIYNEFSFLINLPPCPHLLRPTAAVINDVGFCGFLLPYQPAGSLNIVFSDYIGVAMSGLENPGRDLLDRRADRISWDLKINFAWDIVKGLRFLHEHGIFWGDLTLNNIVLCLDGCCRFIDYYPSRCCSNSAPPEFSDLPFTGPQDIFSLGLVLWCVAHEVGSFTRKQEEIPLLNWSHSILPWYQEIVHQCLQYQSGDRPTAMEVDEIFNMNLK